MRAKLFAFCIALIAILAMATTAVPRSYSAAPAQTMAATEAGMPAITKQIKIALIAPSAKNDLAWTQSMYDALGAVQKEAGGEFPISYNLSHELVPASACR